MTQLFKGDALELQMIEAGSPAFDQCSTALDEMLEGGFEASDFLLSLYDQGRMPFSERVPRASFVNFIKQAIPNAQFTGTFEAYLFIIRSIFGEGSEVLFDVPGPGQLEMVVSVAAGLDFQWVGREFSGGVYTAFDMVTDDGEFLAFSGIPGIESENELNRLLAELIPAGIYPDISLSVFSLTFFAAEDSLGVLDSVVDNIGNQIIFFEPGA